MTIGLQDTGSDARTFTIRLLEGRTTTNSPLTSYAASGVDVGAILDSLYGARAWPSQCGVHVYTTAGSGTMTATVKLWAGITVPAFYSAAGTGSASAAGVLNGGSAFDEHAADVINRLDILELPGLARKFYAEITAIGGTGTAVNVDLIFPAVQS